MGYWFTVLRSFQHVVFQIMNGAKGSEQIDMGLSRVLDAPTGGEAVGVSERELEVGVWENRS